MRATMMDTPLTITAILRYGTTAYRDREVITATTGRAGCAAGPTASSAPGRPGWRARLRSLGIDGDQRVATLMWNNAEHLEAYLAIPSMGAVLHTLNLRLEPAVIGYIADHAGDDVVIVDATLVPLLASVLPHAPSIRHIIVSTPEETEFVPPPELTADGREVHSYEPAPGRPAGRLRVARDRRAVRGRHVLHQRHHRPPEGRRVQPPVDAPALDGRRRWATCSGCPTGTRCCRWCRCSTPTPGACPTRPSWRART